MQPTWIVSKRNGLKHSGIFSHAGMARTSKEGRQYCYTYVYFFKKKKINHCAEYITLNQYNVILVKFKAIYFEMHKTILRTELNTFTRFSNQAKQQWNLGQKAGGCAYMRQYNLLIINIIYVQMNTIYTAQHW